MGETKRSVGCTQRDFLAAWGRGDAGPVPCGACTACCHYPGIVVDEKRDRKRLAHLLTERSPDGELVLQRRSDGACVVPPLVIPIFVVLMVMAFATYQAL